MCCIFTCCGWMVDLIQRLWTFTMSCCISSAVCCALITASMSGIALGYNYSLAEYIDLKETNVSVYLKRGIFDDEIADDMDWRRSGHMPIAGHIGDQNLRTGPDEEPSTARSGRRLDDSILESDDHNRFEGSLMRLTAKAPDPSTTPEGNTVDNRMNDAVAKFKGPPIDQLKAIQSVINSRKSGGGHIDAIKGAKTSTEYIDERYLPYFPAFPDRDPSGRRLMNPMSGPGDRGDRDSVNSARLAVPDETINKRAKWIAPLLPPAEKEQLEIDYGVQPTYPRPITARPGPVRPSRPPPPRSRPTLTTEEGLRTFKAEVVVPQPADLEINSYKERLLKETTQKSNVQDMDVLKTRIKEAIPPEPDQDYYNDEAKGFPLRKRRKPVRRRRNLDSSNTVTLIISTVIKENITTTTQPYYNTENITKVNEAKWNQASFLDKYYNIVKIFFDISSWKVSSVSSDVETESSSKPYTTEDKPTNSLSTASILVTRIMNSIIS